MIEPKKIAVFVFILIATGSVYLLFMARNLINRNQLYSKLIGYYKDEYLKDNVWYKIRYSSESHFERWFKLVPWDGNGILVISDSKIMLLRSLLDEENTVFNKKKANIEWFEKNICVMVYFHGSKLWKMINISTLPRKRVLQSLVLWKAQERYLIISYNIKQILNN